MDQMEELKMTNFLDEKEADRGENPLYDYNDEELNMIADHEGTKPNVFKQRWSAPCNGISGAPANTFTAKE